MRSGSDVRLWLRGRARCSATEETRSQRQSESIIWSSTPQLRAGWEHVGPHATFLAQAHKSTTPLTASTKTERILTHAQVELTSGD